MNDETYGHTRKQVHGEEVYPAGGPAFSALVSISHSIPVVQVRGEVDLATVPQLLKAIGMAGSQLDGRPLLVVDLRETAFMDITGISNLIEQAQAMQGLGGELRVVVPREGPMARVFELLGISRILNLHHELDLELSTDEQAS